MYDSVSCMLSTHIVLHKSMYGSMYDSVSYMVSREIIFDLEE